MKVSVEGKIEIASHEGVCLRPYLDSVGVWTIGIGATRSEINVAAMDKKAYITIEEAFELFTKSLVKYENAVNKALKVAISQSKFDALVSFCYNVGTGGMSGSTLLKRINAGESMDRIGQAFMMWTKPKEITARRRKEMELYTKEHYSNNGTCLQFDTNGAGRVNYRLGKNIEVRSHL